MEGPQIHLYAREHLPPVVGRELLRVGGDRKEQARPFVGGVLEEAIPRGKRLFLRFGGHADEVLAVHCLMFGDVRVNRTRPGKRLTLRMTFAPDERLDPCRVYVYLGAATRKPASMIDETPPDRDVMHPSFDGAAAVNAAAREVPDALVADVLLDQDRFAGLGNVIRVEALFRAGVSPLRTVGSLTAGEGSRLGTEIGAVTAAFYDAVAARGDHAHPTRLVHKGKTCPTCGRPLEKAEVGELRRKAWWCPTCQR